MKKLEKSSLLLIGIGVLFLFVNMAENQLSESGDAIYPQNINEDVLPGTKPLKWQGGLSEKIMDGAHTFIEKKIDESAIRRARLWNPDYSSQGSI